MKQIQILIRSNEMVCVCDLCMCICSQYLHLCVQICEEVRSWYQLAVFLYDLIFGNMGEPGDLARLVDQ